MESQEIAQSSCNLTEEQLIARREYQRQYRDRKKSADPEGFAAKHRESQARYAANNPEKVAENQRQCYEKARMASPEDYRRQKRDYYRGRYREDPDFKLAQQQVHHLGKHLAGNAKAARFGYNTDDLRQHLESQFQPGMTWDNYGKPNPAESDPRAIDQNGKPMHWEIDHIYPVIGLVRQGETDPAVISALSNLRPLWRHQNIRKYNHLPGT